MTAAEQYSVTTTPMHLTVDPFWGLIEVLAYGIVSDVLDADRYHAVVEQKIAYLLDDTRTEVVGFVVRDYAELEDGDLEADGLWGGPRFNVPVLGLTAATVGEAVLAIRGRFAPDEPTADALHFHTAMAMETPADALPEWRLALEAGDMKAHYALGYTLYELGRYRNAYDHLRYYTELVPHNAWAWCWLGKASAALGDVGEARRAYETALGLRDEDDDEDGETDAATLLEELGR